MANLGFIGLGAMGSRITKRLLAKGHTVTGYDLFPAKQAELVAMGGTWASSPRAVCEAADTTFVMVTNTAALEGASQGPDGLLAGLGPGKLLIDMSTVGPAASRALAAKAREKAADMLDAPVSGSISLIESGKLSIMVGGQRATFDRAKPLLEDIGQKVTYIGENGLAVSMKIATNVSIAVQMLALAESVVLAEKAGVARETALEVLTNSAIASPLVQYKAPCILKMPEPPMFSANMMQKDVGLALDLAREVQVTLPTGTVVNDYLSTAREQGLGEQDFAILYKMLATLSGVKA